MILTNNLDSLNLHLIPCKTLCIYNSKHLELFLNQVEYNIGCYFTKKNRHCLFSNTHCLLVNTHCVLAQNQ